VKLLQLTSVRQAIETVTEPLWKQPGILPSEIARLALGTAENLIGVILDEKALWCINEPILRTRDYRKLVVNRMGLISSTSSAAAPLASGPKVGAPRFDSLLQASVYLISI
jgi:hypothetical protein